MLSTRRLAAPLLRRLPDLSTPLELAERRRLDAARPDPRDSGNGRDIAVTRHELAVARGGDAVELWCYRPEGGAARKGAHLMFHPGAYNYGSPRQLDGLARRYASAADCVVVSAGYRLAPEHPWPAGPDDGRAALHWLGASGQRLGIDPRRVSVGGVSAGGGIAALTALDAAESDGPRPIFLVLEIPTLDLTLSQAPRRVMRGWSGGARADLERSYSAFVGSAEAANPKVSPWFAKDLGSLPPVFLLTAQYDVLRHEGEAFAGRLRDAGVPVTAVRARGHVHSSVHSSAPAAQRYQAITAAALARAHRAAFAATPASGGAIIS